MLLSFPLHGQMAVWAGRPCLCAGTPRPEVFYGEAGELMGRYKTETRERHDSDPIRADVLYDVFNM